MLQAIGYDPVRWRWGWATLMMLIPTVVLAASDLGTVEQEFMALIERAQPSVVEITAHKQRIIRSWRLGNAKQPTEETQSKSKQYTYRQRLVGTGWLHDPQGHIVTTARLVEGAEMLEVRLQNGEPMEASLVGKDLPTNIAVLKVGAVGGVSGALQGNSADVRSGAWIVMMGCSYGQAPSLSFGRISAVEQVPGYPLCPFIRFQAPVHPGNTGGILLDTSGEAIGMVVAVLADRKGSPEGNADSPLREMQLGGKSSEQLERSRPHEVGFALPVHFIEPIVQTLIDDGAIQRGYIGVIVPMDDLRPFGITIHSIVPGSPAEKAQLQPDDCVLAVDGIAISNGTDFQRFVLNNLPGHRLRLTVQRGNQQLELTAELGKMPD